VPTAVPCVAQNFVPHVYSNDELRRLLAAVDENQARRGCQISADTFRLLLLLLYGAGLRISEAVDLTREDVDVHAGLVLIRESKFYKSRELPLGPTLVQHLVEYADRARRRRARAQAMPFFTTIRGTNVSPAMARLNFAGLRQRAGVPGRPGALSAPRLHDLRHSFAVNRLIAWYREGADVQRLLPQLSTYLGHRTITSTQRYLTMIPISSSRPASVSRSVRDRRRLMRNPDLLGSWVRRFLLEYLVGERNFAENARHSYRDTLALAIPFIAAAAGTPVDRLLVIDVDADRIRRFLGHLEQARSCRITTRNQRLAALHSLARFIAGRSPEHVAWCSEVCRIPFKKAPHEVCVISRNPRWRRCSRRQTLARVRAFGTAPCCCSCTTRARGQRGRRRHRR
jgi:site-specific recombinase XerD